MKNILKKTLVLVAMAGLSVWAATDTTYIARTALAIPNQFIKLNPGDTLLISPGTYNWVGIMTSTKDGTAAKPIVVRAAAPNTVFIKHTNEELFLFAHRYYVIENLNLTGTGYTPHHFKFNDRAQYIQIRNCALLKFGESSIKAGSMSTTPDSVWPGDYSIMEGCEFSSDTLGLADNGNGFNLNGPRHFTIRNNWIHDLTRAQGATAGGECYSGFFKAAAESCIIENNIIGPGNKIIALCFGGGGTGAQFIRGGVSWETNDICYRNNVFIGCSDAERSSGTNTNRKIYHNTFINLASSSGNINGDDIRNNLYMGPMNFNGGTNNYATPTYTAAHFWDPANRNYALKTTATALIGKVARIDSALTDMLGTARPTMVSYGACEAYASNPGTRAGVPVAIEMGSVNTLPQALSLDVMPNPTQSVTSVRFALATGMRGVEVGIYDLSGRTVRVLYNGPLSAGRHEIRWDGKGHTASPVAAGVYMARLRVYDRQMVKSFTVVH